MATSLCVKTGSFLGLVWTEAGFCLISQDLKKQSDVTQTQLRGPTLSLQPGSHLFLIIVTKLPKGFHHFFSFMFPLLTGGANSEPMGSQPCFRKAIHQSGTDGVGHLYYRTCQLWLQHHINLTWI